MFSSSPVGLAKPNTQGYGLLSERLEWADSKNQSMKRKLKPCTGWRFLQGNKTVSGELLGGCAEVFQTLIGTDY